MTLELFKPLAQVEKDREPSQDIVAMALQCYSIDLHSYNWLQALGNWVFRITSMTGETFCLRVYAPETIAANVQVELRLLESLLAKGTVDVPVPIKTTAGQLWTTVETQHSQCLCALFRWIEGDDLETIILSQTVAKTLGATIAHLHTDLQMAGSSIPLPVRRYSTLWLSRIAHWFDAERLQPLLDQEMRSGLSQVKDEILTDMMALDSDSSLAGWIHGDLHLSNLVMHRGRVCPIDFESFGWGYYVFDLASPLFEMVTLPGGASLRQALLDGYLSVRPLPVTHEPQINRFIIARAFFFVNWILTAPNESVRLRYQHLLPEAIGLINTLMTR